LRFFVRLALLIGAVRTPDCIALRDALLNLRHPAQNPPGY